MDPKQSDGGGILGTPLEATLEGERRFARIAAADKIAPTWNAYERMRQRERVQSEHKLVDEANQEATNERNLYRNSGRLQNNSLEDLMDDEDRENLRLRKIKRASRAISSMKSKLVDNASIDVDSLPFAAASADVPEVVPKPTNLAVGYQILRNENAENPSHGEKKDISEKQIKQLKNYVSKNRNEKNGLGYTYTGNNQNDMRKQNTTSRSIWSRSEIKTSHRYLTVGIPVTEDADISEMANVGFDNLDNAAEKLRMKIAAQRQRKAESRKKRPRSTFTDHDLTEQLFTEFSTIGILANNSSGTKEENFPIPESFVNSSSHDFAKDPFRSKGTPLPTKLQEEYNRVTSTNKSIIRSQELAVENRLEEDTKRKQKELEKLTKFYGDELQSKFVSSSLRANDDGLEDKDGFQGSGSSTITSPIVGKSQRTSEPWVPVSLLCRRFDVPEPFAGDKLPQSDSQNNASISGNLTGEEEEDDFRLHAVVRADGTRINLERGSNFAVEDDLPVLPPGNSNTFYNEVVVRPSIALYRSIYGKANETTKYEEVRKSNESSVDFDKNTDLPVNKEKVEGTSSMWSQGNAEWTDSEDQKSKRVVNQSKASDFF